MSEMSCQVGSKQLYKISKHVFDSDPLPPGVPELPAKHKLVSVSYRNDSPQKTLFINLIDESTHVEYQSFVLNPLGTKSEYVVYFAIPEQSLSHPFEMMLFSKDEYMAEAKLKYKSLLGP